MGLIAKNGHIYGWSGVVDSALDSTSLNPVQNKVVTEALNGKQDTLTIDTALSTASTNPVQNKAITNALGTYVRPNLLDNWYFGNPVNQRGETTYVSTGTSLYTIDRWVIFLLTASLDSSGIILRNTTSAPHSFTQFFEANRILGERTFTLSALTSTGLLYSASFSYPATWPEESNDYVMINTPFGYISSGYDVQKQLPYVRIAVYGNQSVTIVAVKLELGSTQTLAHQENGVWVLNEIPDYGEQLARCQRYQVELNLLSKAYAMPGLAIAISATRAIASIPLPVSLRTTPEPEQSGTWTLNEGTNSYTVSGFTVSSTPANSIALGCDISSGLTIGKVYRLLGNSTGTSRLLLNSNL